MLHRQNVADAKVEGPPDTPQNFFHRGIINRASDAIGGAIHEDWSKFEVDSTLVDAANAAAEAWKGTAAYLGQLRDRGLRPFSCKNPCTPIESSEIGRAE